MGTQDQPTLVIASGNVKKRAEIEQLLSGTPARILTLKDFPDCPEVEETGSTFAENARLKAVVVSIFTGRLTLADDSGLEVDALDGAPGIHSARFASTEPKANASDEDNMRLLLKKLQDVPDEKRSARFVCAVALAKPAGGGQAEILAETLGTVEGRIIHEPRGDSGFGYDPVFFVEQFGGTFAEVGPEKKHRISHRARALEQMQPHLRNHINPYFSQDRQREATENTESIEKW